MRRKRRRSNRLRRWTLRHPWLYRGIRFSLLASIWGAIVLGLAVIYFIASVPDPVIAALDDRPPNVTVLAEDGTVLAERGLRRGHVRLDVLPPYLVQAVLATEDRRFYSHFGVDPLGLVRATFRNATAGTVVEGGSTITQQLAKNLFLTPQRTLSRKLEEAVYALWLEQRFSKKQILELYLNRVYFGGGTYGIEAASRRYFGKSSRYVTLPQAALLAGLLKAPSRYAPTRSVKLADARVDEVLDNMVEAGYLTDEQAKNANDEPLKLSAKDDDTGYSYAVDWVAELLPELVGEQHGDLFVETTIDPALQRASQQALRRILDDEGEALAAGEGAVVVLDPFGGVKALVGGRAYSTSPFDRAVKARRQPGSAFKPFVYLAALEAGYSPDSRAYDGPVTVAGWSPRNYTGNYRGEINLRDSLAHSINTVAVRITAKVGPSRVAQRAARLGIQSELHDRPSIALGTAEVTLLELTGAYAPFANGGQGVLPHIIARVRDGNGKVLYQRRRSTTGQVVAPNDVGAMNDMLSATIRYGTGQRPRWKDTRRPARPARRRVPRRLSSATQLSMSAGVDRQRQWQADEEGDGRNAPATLWHDIMLTAHADKAPCCRCCNPRSATPEAMAALPWQSSGSSGEAPFCARVRILLRALENASAIRCCASARCARTASSLRRHSDAGSRHVS
jgi:penicillin-binding protein 1A